MTTEPTVFIVDDDEPVRQFLKGLVTSVGLRVEPCASANDFLDTYEPDQAGCLLLDIRMPGMSGIELQKELVRRNIDIPIIFLTGHGEVQVAVHAMKAGAVDFIEKPFNNQLLLDRVQEAVAKSVHASTHRGMREEIESRVALLTPRERQVLSGVIAGETNKGISRNLDISEKTVEIHRSKVMEKMQAKSLVDLVKMAQGLNLS